MTVEIVYTPLDEIAAHPRNPKDHDIGAISQSIGRFGYIAPVIIDERTQLLVAGHGRLDALRAMRGQGQKPPEGVQVDAEGNWRVPVIRGVKFRSDEEVAAYLIADNRLTVGGGWNEPALAELLQSLHEHDPLLMEATGYDEGDLQVLLNDLYPSFAEAAADGVWDGMPEFDQPDESCFHSCTIHFKTEADMLHFAKLIGQPVAQTTRYIWIPRQEQLDLKNYRVVDES